jgi:pilus assembly protein CpaF
MRIPQVLHEEILNPQTTDLCLNGGHVFVDRGRGLEKVPGAPLDTAQTKTWVLEVLSQCGRSWDARSPFMDAPWCYEGKNLRMHVVFPTISESGLLVSLRKLPESSNSESHIRWKNKSHGFKLLAQAISRGDSILISGATGSGKTTLATDLLSHVPHSERIIALEDTPELRPHHPHFISLQSRPPNAEGFGEITLRTLLRQALRMRPDRIILGETRGPEAMDLLQALNTGHRGGLATLHANSPRDALKRLETLALLSGTLGISLAVIREWVASGIQWVVQVERLPQEGRRIRDISQVCGIESGVILLRSATTG